MLPNLASDKEFVRKFVLEIKLMSNLNHPNIVLFLGAVVSPVQKMCLVLEFCERGTLFEFIQDIRDQREQFTIHQCLRFAIDVARGMFGESLVVIVLSLSTC